MRNVCESVAAGDFKQWFG